MTKRRKIVLGILIAIIILVGVFIWANMDTIIMIKDGVTETTETIAIKKEEVKNKEKETLEKAGITNVRPLTEEEMKEFNSGNITEKEAIDLILGKTTIDQVKENKKDETIVGEEPGKNEDVKKTDGSSSNKDQSSDSDASDKNAVGDSTLTSDDKNNGSDKPKQPTTQNDSGKPKQPTTQSDSGKPKQPTTQSDSGKPKQPTVQNGSDKPKQPTTQNGSDKPKQPNNSDKSDETNKEDEPKEPQMSSSDVKIAELIGKIYVLEAKFTGELKSLEQWAIDEYMSVHPSKYKEKKKELISVGYPKLAALEKECDVKVEEILSELAKELNAAGQGTELVEQIRNSYADKKQLSKSHYISEYL